MKSPSKLPAKFSLRNSFWYYLVNFWTLVLYIAILGDFFMHNAFHESLTAFLGPICAIYVGALALYSAEKEFERWHDHHTSRHPGEIYVIVWTILILFLLVCEFVFASYSIPSEVFSVYVVVIGILAITKKSKQNYDCRPKKRQPKG